MSSEFATSIIDWLNTKINKELDNNNNKKTPYFMTERVFVQ